jgi:two-component system, cell cycle sensor histidine kinase and response regulator CckA
MAGLGGSDEPEASDATEREVNIAKLALLGRRAGVQALATAINTLLLTVVLWPTAPRPWLWVWALQQLGGATYLFFRARRRRRSPRGTLRGIRRSMAFSTVLGITLGCAVFLLGGADEIAQVLVLVTLAAMASAASTTLAPIPGAARGYIAGALLVPAARWVLQGELEYGVLALLAVSMASFLVFNARLTHEAFLDSLGRARQIEQLSAQFREERAEWLDWSHATEAFVLLDADAKLLLWNSRFEQLVQPAEVDRGRDYFEVLAGARSKPQTVDGSAVSTDEWLAQRKGLGERSAEQLEGYAGNVFYQVSAQRLPSGRQVVTAVNVTALKRTEQALREQDHALAQSQRQESVGVIAGGVAHDFNNLLTTIRGATELIAADATSASASALLHDIRESVDRGARLTRQLLAYGRLTSLCPRVLDLNRELSAALPMYRTLLPASVRIETDFADGLHAVMADPEQLAQVTMNLVLNARDAMPRGGVLLLATANVGGQVELCVCDDGVGMAPETVERIFEPFFSTKDQQRGSGLGLSAVQGIVRQSGGTIQVETQLGAGTTMRVRLPRSELPSVATVPPASLAPLHAGNSEQILVVDDEELVRSLTARLLRRQGYHVTEVESPQAALERLRSDCTCFALLLTDVVMPEMSGVELAAHARQLAPNLPVVFMSGYDPGLLGGIEAPSLLQKPFTPAQLSEAIERALASAPKRSAPPPV